MYSIISTLLLLAATATAIQITFPTKDADINMSNGVTVKWTSVNTDPSSFAIHLVNANIFPTVDHTVADSVQTSAGSFDIKGMSGVKNGQGYQINFISTDPQNSGILAQSQQFNVKGESASLSSSASGTATGSSTVSMSMSSSSATPLGSLTASLSALTPSGTSSVSGTSSNSTAASSTASATGAKTSTGGAVMLGASTVVMAGSVALAGLCSVFA